MNHTLDPVDKMTIAILDGSAFREQGTLEFAGADKQGRKRGKE